MIPSTKARTRQREQGALKAEGIDLLVMPEGLKGRLPRWRVRSVNKVPSGPISRVLS